MAAEKASTPKHSEKRRVGMSTVLARMEFIGQKSEHRQAEKKNQYVSPAENDGRWIWAALVPLRVDFYPRTVGGP